jgi:hypothetical protein
MGLLNVIRSRRDGFAFTQNLSKLFFTISRSLLRISSTKSALHRNFLGRAGFVKKWGVSLSAHPLQGIVTLAQVSL